MKAYERFLKYVRVHTTSSETSGTHPSFDGEFDLARLLACEMREIGISDVKVDEHCYVYGRIPATPGCAGSTPIGFISHMDTSSDASGENVRPVIHEHYDGNAVALPGAAGRSVELSPERFPFLKKMAGETLITSDGSTLLGADDKAGIAEILTAAECLIRSGCEHGTVYIAFTPDEEIGEGTDFFDLGIFGARYAYTIDGGDADCIEYENFNAASADIVISGVSIHPGDAKGAMRNAQRVAFEFDSMIPDDMRPETTEGREGFFHLTDMSGDVSRAELKYIVRDHDREKLEAKKALLMEIAGKLNAKYGGGTVCAEIKDSYYNMLEVIKPHMHLIEAARAAIRKNGMEPVDIPIRGGTDGARLSFMGLPCPNLGTGGFNFHGCCECITAERMDRVTAVILDIIGYYAHRSI